jgi:hypothetical protein
LLRIAGKRTGVNARNSGITETVTGSDTQTDRIGSKDTIVTQETHAGFELLVIPNQMTVGVLASCDVQTK